MSAKDFISRAWNNTLDWIGSKGQQLQNAYNNWSGKDTFESVGDALLGQGAANAFGDFVDALPGSFEKVVNPVSSLKDIAGADDVSAKSVSGSSGVYYPGDSSGSPGHLELSYPNGNRHSDHREHLYRDIQQECQNKEALYIAAYHLHNLETCQAKAYNKT